MSYHEDLVRNAKQVRARLWNAPPRPVVVQRPVIAPPPPPIEPPAKAPEVQAPSPEVEVPNLDAEEVASPVLSRQAITRAVAKHFGIGYSEIVGRPRTARVVTPRQIAIYVCSRATGWSLPAIAKTFGRDHTTALHALRKIETALKKNDAGITEAVKAVMAGLGISFDSPRAPPLINSNPWSEEEVEKLRYLRSDLGYSIERIWDEMPDRSIGAISIKLKRQGITKGKPTEIAPRPKVKRPPLWTPEQDAILRKLYGPRLWALDAADEIKRSQSAVRHRAVLLGLNKKANGC